MAVRCSHSNIKVPATPEHPFGGLLSVVSDPAGTAVRVIGGPISEEVGGFTTCPHLFPKLRVCESGGDGGVRGEG